MARLSSSPCTSLVRERRGSTTASIPLARSSIAVIVSRTLAPPRSAAALPVTRLSQQPIRRAYSALAPIRTRPSTRWSLLLLPLCSLLPLAYAHSTSTATCDSAAPLNSVRPPFVMAAAPSDATTPPNADAPRTVFPTVYLTHGGGPSFFMQVPRDHFMHSISQESINAQWLRDFSKLYRLEGVNAPKAIVVVSAHWITSGRKVRVSSQEKHSKLLYDYYGFPPHTYELKYSPPGNPQLSQRIVEMLQAGGVEAETDPQWDLDHGVFIPLKMIYPDADIPVVEISIDASYDPAFHVQVGRALTALKREGVLLIASGSSTHNFNPVESHTKQFMQSLQAVLEDRSLSVDERIRRAALDWLSLPSARQAHPEEDHYVPMFVALGAAEDQQAKLVGRVEPPGDWHCASFLFESPQ